MRSTVFSLERCYVIAEAGSNHNGDFGEACGLIETAAWAQADAVKFQCLPNLPRDWMPELKACAGAAGIDFMATPFDLEAIEYLAELGVPAIKIASVEIVRLDLIEAAAKTHLPLLLSTGMATWDEVDEALDASGQSEVVLLQCTTAYPAYPAQANLNAMHSMAVRYTEPIGLSDHTKGLAVPLAAVALGAKVIEKHFTHDKTAEGPDHPFALEPDELATMVDEIRQVEAALGSPNKDGPQEGEMYELRGRDLQWAHSIA